MNTLEIFSGAGGLARGLQNVGFSHSCFVEIKDEACETLRSNFPPKIVRQESVETFDFTTLKNIDIVAGGPPCQPFSLGGKHGSYQDSRDMFPHAIRAIETLMPKAFIFENVKGLLRPSFSNYFEYILTRLRYPDFSIEDGEGWLEHLRRLQRVKPKRHGRLQYNVSFKLINAADYGIPQKRERVFIVGVRSDIDTTWEFPLPTHSEDALNWSKYVTEDYWRRHGIPVRQSKEHHIHLLKKYGLFEPASQPWQSVRDCLSSLPDPLALHNIPDHVFKPGARVYPGHTGSPLDEPSKTIKAGGHGVPGGENMMRFEDNSVRYFTVHEAKLIQSFPKDFVITGSWGEAMRQIGNAVPVALSEMIGKNLKALLLQNERRVTHRKPEERVVYS